VPTRVPGSPVIIKTGGVIHRGSWWRDAYGSIIACNDCDVVTRRSRKDDAWIMRTFRLYHTRAAKLPPYQPRHAAPEKEHA